MHKYLHYSTAMFKKEHLKKETFTTTILQDCTKCVLINLEYVPEPNDVMMHQTFVDVVFTEGMSNVTLFLFFTPLSIQPVKLACDISMFHQVICLPKISQFKTTAKVYGLTIGNKAMSSSSSAPQPQVL